MNARVNPRHKKMQLHLWALVLGILLVPCTRGLAADAITVVNDAFFTDGAEAVISDIRVVIDGPPDQQDTYAAMARRLIRMKPGAPLDHGSLQASIDVLKLSHRFSAIHVDSISTASGEMLTFTLTPYRYIEDIRIKGKYPLFERDILNQMTLYPGDPYTRADLSAQTGAIIERYRREGYVDPKVSISAQRGQRRRQRRYYRGYPQGPPLRPWQADDRGQPGHFCKYVKKAHDHLAGRPVARDRSIQRIPA